MEEILIQKRELIGRSRHFLVFYGTQKFSTLFIRAHHRTLSWPSWISSYRHFLFQVHFNSILPCTHMPSKCLSPFRVIGLISVYIDRLSRACYMHEPSHPPQFDHMVNSTIMKYLVTGSSLFPTSCYLLLSFRSKYSQCHFVPRHRQSVKSSRALSCVSCLKMTDVSGTTRVTNIRI
jgi:hypothetical protein